MSVAISRIKAAQDPLRDRVLAALRREHAQALTAIEVMDRLGVTPGLATWVSRSFPEALLEFAGKMAAMHMSAGTLAADQERTAAILRSLVDQGQVHCADYWGVSHYWADDPAVDQ